MKVKHLTSDIFFKTTPPWEINPELRETLQNLKFMKLIQRTLRFIITICGPHKCCPMWGLKPLAH